MRSGRHYISLAVIAAVLILIAVPALAHVGSPDVFLEGSAGPYRLFVTVKVPQVIPGVAEIDVRSESDDVRSVRTTVTTLSGAGAKYAPVPDRAERSKTDPNFFTSSLWLMQARSLQVRVIADGARGEHEMSVPVAPIAQRGLAMPRWLGALLLVLTVLLALGAISIVGAAARESVLDPAATPGPRDRRRGMRAMAITGAIAIAVFYLAFAWWGVDARSYQATVNFFKPPKLQAAVEGVDRLILKVNDPQFLKIVKMEDLIPDHGHLMHLYLIRTPGLDRVWHLHPTRMSDGTFLHELPSMDAGHYRIFADVVHKSGFPFTMVGEIDLPQIIGKPLSGDDSGGACPSMTAIGKDSTLFELPDGGRVVWDRGAKPLEANVPMFLRFEVEDEGAKPAADMQPYMGMAAHVAVVRDDFQVFAHIHPTGSVPMASMMLASTGGADSPDMSAMMAANEKVSPELSIPYGFPQPGIYRIFVQFKRHNQIETAVFNTQVNR